MSARTSVLLAVGGGIALCLGITLPAHAQTSSRWLTDPFGARPSILETGKALPGETQPYICPTSDAGNTSNAQNPLSLEQALLIALCRNPQLQSSWAAIKVQAASLGEAKASYWPTLTTSVGRTNDRTNYPDSTVSASDVNMHTGSATLNWRLLDFGGRAANARASESLLAAALSSHDAAVQKTWGTVASAYLDARTAETTLQAQRRHLSLAEEALLTLQRKESRGAAAQTDTLQAATALAKTKLELSRAQGAQYKAYSTLLYALGLPAGATLYLLSDASPTKAEITTAVGDLSTWIELARTTHPAILSAAAQRQSTVEKAQVAQSEGLPTLDVSMSYYENGRPNQSLSTTKSQETLTSLTLTIPVFAGFANTYKTQGAFAQIEQATAQFQDVENQTLAEVVKAHADTLAAENNLAAAQALVEAAQAAKHSVQRKLDRGATERNELIATESALVDAQTEQANARLALTAAKLKLFASAGSLGLALLH